MSESDDDANLPSAAECEARCQEFAGVTGTDSALAMFYLQDRDWDVQKALNAYFEEQGGATAVSSSKIEDKPPIKRDVDMELPTPVKPAAEVDPQPHRIRLMTWNIDGLDENCIKRRMQAVCQTILKENPDVVFLQEVIPPTVDLLEKMCPAYQLLPGGSGGYFTAMMLKITSVQYEEHNVQDFQQSIMTRNLLTCKAKVKGIPMTLMTSHLESTKDHSGERKRQLKIGFKNMVETAEDRTVVFGGDLNLRDKEIQDVGGIPDRVVDMWEVTGKRPEAKFTWDLRRNDNLEWPHKFKPQCRFDRVYVRESRPRAIKPVYFELVGIERVPHTQKFPSDHWGILCHFDKM